jgi:hypothetical protein
MHIFPIYKALQDGFYLNEFQESYKGEMLSYRTSFEEYTYMSQIAGHNLWTWVIPKYS